MRRKLNRTSHFIEIMLYYTKYQIFTKGIMFLLIFPMSSWITKKLIQSTGRMNISSGDYLGFIFSVQGVGILILLLLLLLILIGIDINSFIIMSAIIREKKIKPTKKQLIYIGIQSIKNFLKPSGFLVMIYIATVIPLIGIGFTITPMQGFEIPNFITDVIFKNQFYSILYFSITIFLIIISFLHLFTFHYILICNQQVLEGIKNARLLMKKYWKSFLYDFVFILILVSAIIFILFVGVMVMLILKSHQISDDLFVSRALMIWGMFSIVELLSVLMLLALPVIIDRLTVLFYQYNLRSGNLIAIKETYNYQNNNIAFSNNLMSSRKVGIVFIGVVLLLFNILIASIGAFSFDKLFKPHRNIDIVAHRGGGDLAAENSLVSLEAAIDANVAWSEIDVQRTKDKKYIINHDTTFERLTGNSSKSTDLTLAEIKQLRINDLFDESRPSQEVATLEEILEVARGRIKLFIELKGSTADQQMADDVITMIKEREMIREVAILSLDYSLIQYIEEKYPEIDTGFLYFFAIGDVEQLQGDFLVMEEKEATPEKIVAIQNVGKKAIVWTVNEEDSIKKFVNSNVDGIITDHVLSVKKGIEQRDSRSDYEVIIDKVLE